MSITYTRVTWYSQLAAIILFVAVFYVGMHLGAAKAGEPGASSAVPAPSIVPSGNILAAASYSCPNNRYISALYYDGGVRIILSDGREYSLPHAISADGARYANADESFVFWNKGTGAFTMENGKMAWDSCVSK